MQTFKRNAIRSMPQNAALKKSLTKKIAHLMFETLIMCTFMRGNDLTNARKHRATMRIHLEFGSKEIEERESGSLLFGVELNGVDGIVFGFDGSNVFFSRFIERGSKNREEFMQGWIGFHLFY